MRHADHPNPRHGSMQKLQGAQRLYWCGDQRRVRFDREVRKKPLCAEFEYSLVCRLRSGEPRHRFEVSIDTSIGSVHSLS